MAIKFPLCHSRPLKIIFLAKNTNHYAQQSLKPITNAPYPQELRISLPFAPQSPAWPYPVWLDLSSLAQPCLALPSLSRLRQSKLCQDCCALLAISIQLCCAIARTALTTYLLCLTYLHSKLTTFLLAILSCAVPLTCYKQSFKSLDCYLFNALTKGTLCKAMLTVYNNLTYVNPRACSFSAPSIAMSTP